MQTPQFKPQNMAGQSCALVAECPPHGSTLMQAGSESSLDTLTGREVDAKEILVPEAANLNVDESSPTDADFSFRESSFLFDDDSDVDERPWRKIPDQHPVNP
jgi:hypothetical protein